MPKVLVIDDSQGSARKLALSRVDPSVTFVLEPWRPEMPGLARVAAPDLIVLCASSIGTSAAACCAALRAEPTLDGVPLLVCGAAELETELARCVAFGADDALVLPLPEPLIAARISAMLDAHEDRRARNELSRALEERQQALRMTVDALRRSDLAIADSHLQRRYLETHDSLTSLANRTYYRDQARRALAWARRYRQTLAVLAIDLDGFERVNGNLGHGAGDELLRSVAARLRSCVRGSDLVARLGGDEFAVLATNLARGDDAALVAQKILDVAARPHEVAGRSLLVTPSIGIAVFPEDGETIDTLLRCADLALHRSKEAGCGQYRFYSTGMHAGSLERMKIEVLLRDAAARGELSLAYQPQVDVEKRALIGVEALARWTHPELGSIPPSEFIPIAEGAGLIGAIGEWVLREAAAQKKRWSAEGLGDFPVAVNLSARQLKTGDLLERVGAVLASTGLDPRELELELTENALMEDVERARLTLGQLVDLGVRISIDDFGTGYSSLAVLGHFRAHALKLDRQFVRDVSGDHTRASITRAILSVARELGLEVIAEGVENVAERDWLLAHGCSRMQGYLFSMPQPAESITTLLRDPDELF